MSIVEVVEKSIKIWYCHPYVGFDNKNIRFLGLSEEKVLEWQRKRNLLPNLQFLESSENESKNKTPLKKWVDAGNTFEYCPKGISLDLKDFESFFNGRKALMKKERFNLFDLTYDESADNVD